MTDLFYCAKCDLVYRFGDTHEYYATGFPTLTSARGCPVDGDKLRLLTDDETDLSVVDYGVYMLLGVPSLSAWHA